MNRKNMQYRGTCSLFHVQKQQSKVTILFNYRKSDMNFKLEAKILKPHRIIVRSGQFSKLGKGKNDVLI